MKKICTMKGFDKKFIEYFVNEKGERVKKVVELTVHYHPGYFPREAKIHRY